METLKINEVQLLPLFYNCKSKKQNEKSLSLSLSNCSYWLAPSRASSAAAAEGKGTALPF